MKYLTLIVITALAVLLACSMFLNILIFKLLGIRDLESFKQTMLAKELLDSFSELSDDSCVD